MLGYILQIQGYDNAGCHKKLQTKRVRGKVSDKHGKDHLKLPMCFPCLSKLAALPQEQQQQVAVMSSTASCL